MVNYSLLDPQRVHCYQLTDSLTYRRSPLFCVCIIHTFHTFFVLYQEERTYHGFSKKSMNVESENDGKNVQKNTKELCFRYFKICIICSPRKLIANDAGGWKFNNSGSGCDTNPFWKRKKWRFNKKTIFIFHIPELNLYINDYTELIDWLKCKILKFSITTIMSSDDLKKLDKAKQFHLSS